MSDQNEKKKSFYIFNFGNAGAGKSTLVASLAKAITESDDLLLRINPKDIVSTLYLEQHLLSLIDRNEFPDRTPVNLIQEIDFGFDIRETDTKLKFTFLEIAGDELNIIYYKWKDLDVLIKENVEKVKNQYKEFITKYEKYLNLSDLILIVTEANKAKGDDMMLLVFMETLKSLKINKPVLLIISKWDTLQQKTNVLSFAKEKLNFSYKYITKFPNYRILDFSVGKIQNADKIEKFDSKYSKIILQELLNILTNNE